MHRVARILRDRSTAIDEVTDIHQTVFADDDVVSTGAQRIAGLDDHAFGITGMTGDVKSAHDAIAMQVTIVQSVLLDDVVIEPIEILIGQQLARKEPRTAETFKASTGRTGRRTPGGRVRRVACCSTHVSGAIRHIWPPRQFG